MAAGAFSELPLASPSPARNAHGRSWAASRAKIEIHPAPITRVRTWRARMRPWRRALQPEWHPAFDPDPGPRTCCPERARLPTGAPFCSALGGKEVPGRKIACTWPRMRISHSAARRGTGEGYRTRPGPRTRPVPGHVRPCLPSPGQQPPHGPGWFHEIKHDGFRIMARRDGGTIWLFTRNGYDWARNSLTLLEPDRVGGEQQCSGKR
jgi:hypothetical protein